MRSKIYLFGDSITEMSFSDCGWGSSLANHFSRTADVVLRGYSGYNTRWALKVMKNVLHPSDAGDEPIAVTVFFGANDACLPDRCSSFQHVPLEEYKENLHAMVAFIKQWPSTRILLITPPPIDETARILNPLIDNPSGLAERTNESAGKYAKACLEVAAESKVAAVDLWTKMQQISGWQKAYLVDGLHLTENGNKVVFEEVVAELKKGGVSLESIPFDCPLITEMDIKNPFRSFEH